MRTDIRGRLHVTPQLRMPVHVHACVLADMYRIVPVDMVHLNACTHVPGCAGVPL